MGESRGQPEEIDPLEAELASFRPRPMPAELYVRIDANLAAGPHRRLWVRAALVGLAAAACVTIVVMTWSHPGAIKNVVTSNTRPSLPISGKVAGINAASSPPTLTDYRRAFAESSEAFNALLDRPAGSETAPVRAFSHSSIDSMTTNGD